MTLLSAQGCAPGPRRGRGHPRQPQCHLRRRAGRLPDLPEGQRRGRGTGATRRRRSPSSRRRSGLRPGASTRRWPRRAPRSPGTGTARPRSTCPRCPAYPQWFVVAVNRTTVTGGKPGATDSTLMLFAREKKTEDWTLSGTAVLSRPLPAIARDADGYAVPVSTTDSSLLLRPDVVGATQAAVVDDGPSSPAAARDRRRAADDRAARGAGRPGGRREAPRPAVPVAAAGGAVAAGRAAPGRSGSALIMYGMYLNTSNEHPNLVAGSPSGAGRVQTAAGRAHRDRLPRGGRQLGVPVRRDRPAGHGARRQAGRHRSQRGPSFGHAY